MNEIGKFRISDFYIFYDFEKSKEISNWILGQACTEMVMPTSGNNKESIFPASTYSYMGHAQYCEEAYNVQPRPTWITTEFGGHVWIHNSVLIYFNFTCIVRVKREQ